MIELHESIEVAVPLAVKPTVVALREQVRLVRLGGERLTKPAKLSTLVRLMVEAPMEPALMVAGTTAWPAILKSPTWITAKAW